MGDNLIDSLFIFMLACFIGFEVIRHVSPLAAHSADVAYERPRRHSRHWRDCAGGRAQEHVRNRAGHHRHCRRHQQCGRWILYY
jgi:hypothetical protein